MEPVPYALAIITPHHLFAGTSTPPGISAAVPSIATPIGVNGFSALPPQTNGQPTSEPIYTNGIHPYPGETFHIYIKETGNVSTAPSQSVALALAMLAACTDSL